MKCLNCGMKLEKVKFVWIEEQLKVDIVPVYKCKICKSEYYDVEDLKGVK